MEKPKQKQKAGIVTSLNDTTLTKPVISVATLLEDRVMFFLLYGETETKAKGGNRDVIERYDTHKGDIRKIRHSGPG